MRRRLHIMDERLLSLMAGMCNECPHYTCYYGCES